MISFSYRNIFLKMKTLFLVTIAYGFLINGGLSSQDDCIIEIENGKIRGIKLETTNNNTIYAFLEIPYAAPPIGNLRFKEPQPPQNWTGILETTKITKICIELKVGPNKIIKSQENEDCLYLNVYVPEFPRNRPDTYPVVVYIYGGRFSFGNTLEYNPQLFVEEGVIFVIFNFRSGPFGFLTTEDGVIPANLGLRDQNFALKWIQKNIHYFGGDPTKVTIMGHSSGGACVSHQIASKKSEGLFRSAIIQSSNGISHMSIMKNARAVAYEVGKAISHEFTESNSTIELYKMLLDVPAEILANVSFKVPDKANGSILGLVDFTYGPVIENSELENTFLEGLLHDNIMNGNFSRVPILSGITSEEILGLVNFEDLAKFAKYFDENPESLFSKYVNLKKYKKIIVGRTTKNVFTNLTFQEDNKAFVRLINDYIYNFPIIREAELRSRYVDVFFYQFSFRGELNCMTISQKNDIGGLGRAGHSDEVSYLLYLHVLPEFKRSAVSYDRETALTQNRLIRIWTNFIKNTNPTPEVDPDLQNITWPKFSRKSLKFLDIDIDLKLRKNPRNYTKWLPIFEKYYDFPIDVI